MFPIIQNAGSAIQAASRGLVGAERTIAQALTGIEETNRPVEQTQADHGSNPDRNPQASITQRGLSGNGLDRVVGQAVVSMMAAENEVKANVAVIKTSDEMIGSLLDVMA